MERTAVIVIDCTSAPSTQALRAAGVDGVCRYISWLHQWGGVTHSSVNPKVIQQAEYTRLTQAGFKVVLNWEYDAQDWRAGKAAGNAHAKEWVRQARALGYPQGWACYGSADFNLSRADWLGGCKAYAVEFANVVDGEGFTPGVYGPYDALTWCRDEVPKMRRYWQAGMSTSWSAGRNAGPWPGAHLRQRRTATIGGLEVDTNDILQSDYYTGDDMTPEEHAWSNNADKYLWHLVTRAKDFPEVIDASGKPVAPVVHNALDDLLQGIDDKVDALSTGGVDLDALAAKVAALLPAVPTAAQIADELAKRLQS